MNTAIIVMTILGCGQGEVSCEYLRTVGTTYASRAQCLAGMEAELLRTADADYPSVIAQCEPLDAIVTGPGPEVRRDDMHTAVVVPPLQAGEPGPVPDGAATQIGEPLVIYSEFDEGKPRSIVRRALRRTGDVIAGAGRALGNGLRKLGGASRSDAGPQGTDPIVLSRYAGEES
ncbi:MAG: hypothetical protein VYD64_04705 [Pseudomonadota bacterium]|nr:hypothetical protein [Pseudomonadota bacterium]